MAWINPWWRPAGGGVLSSYDSVERTKQYLSVAYGKIVFASAGGYNSIWGKNTIDLPNVPNEDVDTLDENDNNKTTTVTARGLYTRSDPNSDKFKPKSHLVSITTSGMDELGMNQKGSYTYRTYGGLGKVPAIGDRAGMSWGWAYGGQVLASEGFTGKVMGYNVSSNSEGGFDVTVDLLGNNTSVVAANMSVDAATPTIKGDGTTDAAGNTKEVSGVISAILDAQAKAMSQKTSGPATFTNGLTGVIIEAPEDYASPKDQPATEGDTTNPQYMAYVTFASVVECCNKVLAEYLDGVQIKFADGGRCPGKITGINAGDPLELLIPGNATYGPKAFPTVGTFDGNSDSLLINCEKMKEFAKFTIEERTTAGGQSRRLSIKTFFDSIFRLINDNCGQAYALTLANSADRKDKDIYIVDFNRIPNVGAVPTSPYRSATLSAQLDSDQAAIFYIKKNTPSDVKVKGGNTSTAPTPPDYPTLLNAVGASADPQNVAALKSGNKTKMAEMLSAAAEFGTAAPWKLSVTLDGIGGWQYGGVISNPAALAAKVPNYKVGFAITNVTHNVSAGDWTVSLDTYCRIY
jgi:hypothetical protein